MGPDLGERGHKESLSPGSVYHIKLNLILKEFSGAIYLISVNLFVNRGNISGLLNS